MSLREHLWIWLGSILLAPPCRRCGYDSCPRCTSVRDHAEFPGMSPETPDWQPSPSEAKGCAGAFLFVAALAWTFISAGVALVDYLLGAHQ